ncbi:hypothetical protein BC943DRAFT_308251 [Umbelopsis sp. AD052]|nr:hypothetical protein BC943DRAFT_308251 [Umbelopsis sp. AD052]
MKRPTESRQAPRHPSDYEYASVSDWDSDLEMSEDKSRSRNYSDEDFRQTLLATNAQMSSSYYVTVADRSMQTLKGIAKDDGNWKKALKHKSGVIVYIRPSTDSAEKAPVFKGEGIIRGYTPQTIFQVIGMRKLWDETFIEGSLLENLNDTTSITYEVLKQTSSSKATDLCLVEKIECTSEGIIYFACASVDTPKKPKINGRTRTNVKLLGWILKPLQTSPPSTRITYVVQESSRGWMQGFTKKTMARKPLVIASIDKYLQEKAERLYPQNQISRSVSARSSPSNHRRRPSLLDERAISQPLPIRTTSLGLPSISSPVLNTPRYAPSSIYSNNNSSDSINTTASTNAPSNVSTPHTSVSSSPSVNRRRIRFADESEGYSIEVEQPDRNSFKENIPSILVTSPAASALAKPKIKPPHIQVHSQVQSQNPSQNLYPSHRHLDAKQKSISLLKLLSSTNINEWTAIDDEPERTYLKSIDGLAMPIFRRQKLVTSGWTVEQLCTVVQNFGARKIWDPKFVDGKAVERFSQKDYLLYTKVDLESVNQMRDFALLGLIDSEPASGIVYYVSTSVEDQAIPKSDRHVRGHVYLEGWVFEPEFDASGRTRSVMVTYFSHIDYRQPITQRSEESLHRLLTQDAINISSIEKYLSKYGCPPYIRRVAGKVSKETFDASKKMYGVAFIVKYTPSIPKEESSGAWCTDIRVHSSMYPNGFRMHISSQKGVRVDLRPDSSGIRVYTTLEEMDGSILTVNIMPQDAGLDAVPFNTCNNQPLLPGGSYPMVDTERKLSATSDTSSISSDSQYQDAESGIAPDATHSSATPITNIIVSDPISTTSEQADMMSPVRQETPPPLYGGITENHKDEHERIDAVEQPASPVISNRMIKPAFEDPFPNFDIYKPLDREAPDEGFERERRGSLASILTNSDKVLIINEELYFNRQQLAFVVFVMVICYYMGKFSCTSKC